MDFSTKAKVLIAVAVFGAASCRYLHLKNAQTSTSDIGLARDFWSKASEPYSEAAKNALAEARHKEAENRKRLAALVFPNPSYIPVTHFDRIHLHRERGFWGGSIFELEILGDGTVDYQGRGDVKIAGVKRTVISKDKIDALVAAINETQYSYLSQYNIDNGNPSDSASGTSSVSIDGKQYSFGRFLSSYGPISDKINKFDEDVIQISGAEEWIGSKWERGIISSRLRGEGERSATHASAIGDINYLQAYSALGQPAAQYQLGIVYEQGTRGVDSNEKMAFDLIERAARQGYHPAEEKLGELYGSGRGTRVNHEEAYFWLTLAVTEYINDNWKLLRDQTEKQLTPEQVANVKKRVSEWNRTLEIPTEDEVGKIIHKWFEEPAEAGEVQAQLDLANYYWRNGPAVKAAPWYRKAAERGNREAQRQLASFYEDGIAGIPKNEVEAYYWYSLAKADEARRPAQKLTANQIADVNKRVAEWAAVKD